MNEYLIIVLEKMFEMVGEKFTLEFVKQPQWYWLREWDQETEDEFAEWLFKYMKANKEVRNALMQRPSNNTTLVKQTVAAFIWQYGWKIKKEVA